MMTVFEGLKGELAAGTTVLALVDYNVTEFRDGDSCRYVGRVRTKPSILRTALNAPTLRLGGHRITLNAVEHEDWVSFHLDRFP